MDEESLDSKVVKWLELSGFPLEMRVHAAFSESSLNEWKGGRFELYPNSFYLDPESGQQREVDLIASWVRNRKSHDYLVTLTIECKSTADPWVVLKYSEDEAGAVNDIFDPSCATFKADSPKVKKQALFAHIDFEEVLADAVEENELFDGTVPGYSVVTAFKSKNSNDAAHSAVLQVISATMNAGLPDSRTLSSGRWVSYSVPLIVTTSPIYEAVLDSANGRSVKARRVDHSIVKVPVPGQSGTNTTLVCIFNEAAVPLLLKHCEVLEEALTGL